MGVTSIFKVTRDIDQFIDLITLWPRNTKLEFIESRWQEKRGENLDSPDPRLLTTIEYEEAYGKPPLPGESQILKITLSESIKPRSAKFRMPKGLGIGLLRKPRGAKS